MKLPSEMIERTAKSLCDSIGPEFGARRWDQTEHSEHHRVQWRVDARAALEAALTDCPREWVSSTSNGLLGIVITDVELIGKRVALVVLDD